MRLSPLAPPYPPSTEALLDSLKLGLPEPIALFRTLAHAPRVLGRIRDGGLLDRGPVPLRLRELMILRTTARCGAGYEWGVHVAGFAQKAGFSEAEIRASTAPIDAHPWGADEALVLGLADALHTTSKVPEPLAAAIAERFSPEVRIELVALAGFYHLISFQIATLGVECEPWAPTMPAPTF